MYTLRTKKIQQPILPPQILHRAALVDTLHLALVDDSSAYKLLLLCAPAGYGKKTLLADFASHTDLPCCWYFLDRADNDICVFVQTLLASLRHKFLHVGEKLAMQIADLLPTLINADTQGHVLQTLVDYFVSAIETEISTRFAIFLCNYHEINDNETIRAFLDLFLCSLPHNCVLGLESRAVPTLKLTLLMVQGQMLGIGSSKLRFASAEIRQLSRLQKTEPFSEQEAEYLENKFEGWIAGIMLTTRLGNVYLFPETLAERSVWYYPILYPDRQLLFSYLMEQVFKDESEVYTFLKEVSLLQHITPEICDRLLDISNGESLLADVEQRGFFLTRSGKGPHLFYVIHPILRDLLYNDACHQDMERMIALHRRAAEIFETLESYEQAIAHNMAIHAEEQAALIIQSITKHMLQQGHAETLAHLIDALRSDILDAHPQLLLVRANIHLQRNEYAQAHAFLEHVHELAHRASSSGVKDLIADILAEVLIAQSSILFQRSSYQEAQQLYRQALALLPFDEKELRSQAYQRLGVCAYMLGDLDVGIAQLHRALQLCGQQGDSQVVDVHSSLANAYSLQGNSALSEHHRLRALSICEQKGDMRGKINGMIWQAILLRERGLFAEAENMFLDIISNAQQEQFLSGSAYALFSLGETYLDQDHFEKALMTTEDALALAYELNDNYLINQVLCSLALVYLFMGDVPTAQQFLDRVTINSTPTTGYEVALCEQTRGTILLWQSLYQEAFICLHAVRQAAHTTHSKRLSIQTAMRMGICQNALGQVSESEQMLRHVTALAQQSGCESLVLIELRRFPALQMVVRKQPEPVLLLLQPEALHPLVDDVVLTSVLSPGSNVVEAFPTLEIYAFGEPKISIQGHPITHWRMARSIELCFFLLDCNRPVRQEQLLSALWEEVDEKTSQTLRSAIHHLRRAIGSPCIRYESSMYTLNLAALYGKNVRYDVGLFRQIYGQAQQALKEGQFSLAKSSFQQAIDMYHGDYVQSFYGNWCIAQRDELRRLYLNMLREMALIDLTNEQFEESATHWRHILAIDNCSEEAHYGLMRCYLRMGRRGLALRQYQRCLETLQDELAVSPGPSIQRLYQKLTTGTI
jgi:LuxR family transcriptional regulator, maltose regulon positive regulatory protein